MTNLSNNPTPLLTMQTAESAKTYFDYGWEPVPLKNKSKKPSIGWKDPLAWTEETLESAFSRDQNIAVALGSRSNNLIDVDFDCEAAARLGEVLLAHLPSFGRDGARSSHRLAYATLERNSTVRRQGFWFQRLRNLSEYLAHLVSFIMRRTCGVASAGFRVFCV